MRFKGMTVARGLIVVLAVAIAAVILADSKAKPLPNAPPALIDASKYASLQAALDAVPESGGLVTLPPGEFRLERPLVLSRGHTRVVGSGPATRLINCNRQGEPALIVRAATPKNRLWRVELANFRINGDPDTVDGKSTKPSGGDGLLVEYVNELFVHGMTIDHHGGHGIHLVHCYEDPRIADCLIAYNAQAGLNIVAGHDIVVNANHFEENQDALRCIDSFNLCMNGNNIDDHLRDGVVIENTYGSVLSGNMIEECHGRAIVLDRDCYGITLSANVIAHNSGGGIDLIDAWGCTVSANTFTINARHGLRVGPQAGRITVTGNNFSDSFVGPKPKRENKPYLAGGIVLEGAAEITITGNVFSGLDAEAVRADAQGRHIVIANNVMTDLNRKKAGPGKSVDLGGAREVVQSQNLESSPSR